MITITELNIYPVKGLRGINLASAKVMARGLEYDREWLVVDANGKFLTQRVANLMATIETQITPAHLVLKHDSMPSLQISLDHVNAASESVTIWRDTCLAVDQGDDAADWLTEVLQANDVGPVRLMRFALDGERPVETEYLFDVEDAQVGFADAYPYLVTNEATLEKLNGELDESVPMNRFRPNIVLQGLPALDEHKLSAMHVKKSEVSMLLPKPCQRCVVTTINQLTGDVTESRQPLRKLVQSNTLPDLVGGFFGQNGVVIEGLGNQIQVGDKVQAVYA